MLKITLEAIGACNLRVFESLESVVQQNACSAKLFQSNISTIFCSGSRSDWYKPEDVNGPSENCTFFLFFFSCRFVVAVLVVTLQRLPSG